MPRICGSNGCVFVPNRPAPPPTNSSGAIMGYDAMGNPVYAGQNDRGIVSQTPGYVMNPTPAAPPAQSAAAAAPQPTPVNPNDPTGRLYRPYPGPYQSHLPLDQRTDLVNGQPPESIMFTRGGQESIPNRFPSQYVGQVPNPIQTSIDFNRQMYPTAGDRLQQFGQSIGALDTPGTAGTPGNYQFRPAFPSHIQGPYEELFTNSIKKLNSRITGSESPFDAIAAQARRDYQTKTLPTIAEQFTAMGGQNSSTFPGVLQLSGQHLDQDLAALKGQYDLDQQRQLMNLLDMQPYHQVYEGGAGGQPGRTGWLRDLAEAGAYAGIGALTGGPAGAAAGGLSSLFNSLRNRRSQNNQPISAPVSYAPSQPQNSPTPNAQQQGYLDNLSKRIGPGYSLTPQDVQVINAIKYPSAAQDFEATFQQPKPLSKRLTPQQAARFAGFNKAGVL